MAFLGYALAAVLLLSFESIVWISLAFPCWFSYLAYASCLKL
jgi:hypothetical protein